MVNDQNVSSLPAMIADKLKGADLEIKLARNYSSPAYRGYVLGVFVLAYSFNFIDRACL